MTCPQCKAIEEVFDEKGAEKERKAFLKDGADKQERLLIEALQTAGVADMSVIDIGGGVGAVQIGLLEAGATSITSVEASTAYIHSSKKIYTDRGLTDKVNFKHGDFVEMAENLAPAAVVTLVRSVCCYPDFKKLVKLSVERAGKLYGLVYPRDTWWLKAAFRVGQPLLQLFKRTSFQIYVHPTDEVEEIIRSEGLSRRYYQTSGIWQVVVFER